MSVFGPAVSGGAFSRHAFVCCLTLAACGSLTTALHAQVDVLTNRYDGARTGANLNEAKLTPANVNVSQFGKLYSYPVDGAVYAQPLYVSGLTVQGAVRNVLYVATMNDKVYAFDADSASPTPLWMRDFTNPPSVTAVPITDINLPARNIQGNVGIQGTPVIDRGAKTIYLVARTKENGTTYVQRLHALDITTGQSRPGSPVTITGSVPGSAPDATIDSSGTKVIAFNAKMHQQRPALALSNGVVLVAWAGHEDKPPYHGWIMGFDATTLARVGIFLVTRDTYGGGIWQGGRAPTLDAAGNAYYATGNSTWDGQRNFGDTLLKFSVSRSGLTLLDFFTPGNEATLNVNDDDLSGSGFTLLPGTNRLLGGGKEGVLYLLDADNLGRKVTNDTQIPQKIAVNGGHVMGGPVYWNSATLGPLVYNWSENDVLVVYRLMGGVLVGPYAQGLVRSPGHPGGSLTVSANGSAANTGIIWASIPTSGDVKNAPGPGMMRAYHAETLKEIWTSEQNATRDRVGTMIKFVPPVVANGRVYLPRQENAVHVYGLLAPDFSVSVTPSNKVIAGGSSGTFTVNIGSQGGFSSRVDLSASGAPAGTTVTFNPQSITGAGASTMTVAVAPGSTGSFNLTVSGTSGMRVHSANPVTVTTSLGAEDIVLYPRHASPIVGTWRVVADSTAAGGARLEHPDAGAAKITTPLAAPKHYFELTFTARANVPYRLWLRGRAQNNSYANDSVYVQFSGSVTSTGTAVNRIGTAEAAPIVLEDCNGCGLAGWGWQDNGFGVGVLGPEMYFTAGTQTIRVQGREDGISLDQIVLSPQAYLHTSPGATKNDTVILPESSAAAPSATIVRHAARSAVTHGSWRVVADSTAAGGSRLEHPDAGAPKLTTPLANPVDYFELTFTAKANVPYRFWLRGRARNNAYANDSVYVQFSGSVTSTGTSINRIGTTEAAAVVVEDCGGCGLSGWGWQDNGYGTNVLGPEMYFTAGTQTIRIQGREDGISIDQIVLSPDTYLKASPGATKNDTVILPASDTAGETVVQYPAASAVAHGGWRVVADSTAAGGSRIEHPDAGAAKLLTPLASPVHYFELTFAAKAGVPYRLWLRGRAQNNSWTNDSVYVQFSGSVTSTGAAVNRIGTTEATTIVLEDCGGCGLTGWAWQDNGYGANVLGPEMYFTAGTQTIRIQTREDGVAIDQIVVSPDTYLNTSPGAAKNDTVIVPKTP